MRVLFMGHAFPPRHCAGGEMMVKSMLAPLVERGHDVHVLLSRDWEPDDYTDDVGIHVHAYRSKDDPWDQVDKADVVMSHLENTPRATILSRMYHKPHVYIVHNDRPASRTWVSPEHGLIVFNSEWMREALDEPGLRSLVIRPPVIGEHYRTTPGDRVTLINLWDEKGGKVFVELARRMPDVQFLGVTGGYGVQETTDLPNVEILPHVRGHQLMRDTVYARTRILLMPSLYESWGRTSVEAAHSGIPTIATPTPGLLEALGPTGTFADFEDIDEWQCKLTRLLHGPAWLKASRAASARALELDPTEELARWVEAVEALT